MFSNFRSSFCTCLFQKLKYEGEEIDDDLEDSYYLRRLEAGLFTLQLLDYIMLEICATGPSSVSHYTMSRQHEKTGLRGFRPGSA